jgi:hypothetical protein
MLKHMVALTSIISVPFAYPLISMPFVQSLISVP